MTDEFAELESLLAGGARPEPEGSHKARVMAAVRAELSRPQPDRFGFWQTAAAVAATVVLACGFVRSAALETTWRLREPCDYGMIAAQARELQESFPQLTAAEARAQVLRQCARSRLARTPRPETHLRIKGTRS